VSPPEASPSRPRGLARAILRRPLVAAAVFAVVASLAGIHGHSLWSPDEPREAGMALEMHQNGLSALPTLGGEPFLEKPPLFFWLAATSYQVFGVNEAAERVPAVIFGALATLAAYAIARATSGRRAALVAAVFAASFSTFWSVGHRGCNDVVLGAACAGAHALLVRARAMAERGAGWRCALGAGFCTGVAFMAKGVIGPVLIAGPATLAWVVLRDGVVLRRVFPWFALFSVAFVAAFGTPWAVALAGHPGGWQNVWDCTLGQVIGRVMGDQAIGPHNHPAWFYLQAGWGSLLPWVAFLPAMLLSPIARRRMKRRPLLDAWLMFLLGVLLLSIPSGKRASYLFPLLPLAAAAPADWFARLRAGEQFGRRFLQWIMATASVAGVGVTAFALLLASGRAPIAKFAPIAAEGARAVNFVVAALGLAIAFWLLRIALRLRRDATVRAGVREVLAFAAVGLVLSHAVARPFLEPLEWLYPAAKRIAAAVPAGEPMVAFNPSETMRAMIPFYGRRPMARIKTHDVLGEMAAHGARHLVVLNDNPMKLPPDVAARLRPIAEIPPDLGFDATVYELR
jgi:4-amino-4-deoxy-L-arabinose transferase-like glycosyltransferase